jgi:hypothetical protein
MLNSSSLASFSLLSTFIVGKFSPNDDVVDVCEIEDVKKASNLAPAYTSFSMSIKFSLL